MYVGPFSCLCWGVIVRILKLLLLDDCAYSILVMKAYRLQNTTQWNLYRTRREVIAAQHTSSRGTSANNVQSLTLKSIIEFYASDEDKLAKHGLLQDANESYLFHGTKVQHHVSRTMLCMGVTSICLCSALVYD